MKIEKVNKLSTPDLVEIISLHKTVLNDSVLNKLGDDFLNLVYQEFAEGEKKVMLIVRKNRHIVGVLTASISNDGFYKDLMGKNILLTLKIALRIGFFNTKLFLTILQLLFFSRNDILDAELYFLAVDSKFQRQGIGTMLLNRLNEEFARQGIKKFIVFTKSKNLTSNNFYKKLKFKYLYSDLVLGDKLNFYESPSTFGKG
jgi:ribosomal protein S18 acetylase RimI-like enzyme